MACSLWMFPTRQTPKLLSTYTADGLDGTEYCSRVTVWGSTAYLSCGSLRMVDVASAVAPRLVATCQGSGHVSGFDVAGTLFVADVGLWIYGNLTTVPDTGVPVTAVVGVIVVVVVGSVLVVALCIGLYCYNRRMGAELTDEMDEDEDAELS
eukprot:TRINITY_DN1316_c0_g1_i1.p2 TRINITY_DN1316_c0_g1~~TRINITY_DN1316_c0_g1_i1.p2  ORF type:complete len:152 (+),score=10.26 TRINITY_DN1316_c0_g1_i1:229-684(+)